LMIMGGDLTRYVPKTGVRVRIVENDVSQLQTLKLSRSTCNVQRKFYGLQTLPCKYYIWRNVWEKVLSH
jgi:hypothetical protein